MNHKSAYIEGKDIIIEDLRERCLFNLVKAEDGKTDKWWEYMQYVHRMCYEEITESCSKLGHKQIGKDYDKTWKCVEESFESTGSGTPNF